MTSSGVQKSAVVYVSASQFISLTVVFSISSARGDERRGTEGSQLWRQWSRAQFGHQTQRERCEGGGTWAWDVRKERCPDSISSPPMGIPRMLQQCGNRLHPITPEALYPQSALVSKTDNLTVLNLFKGFQGSWKDCRGWEINHFCVFVSLGLVQKKHPGVNFRLYWVIRHSAI